MNTLRYFSLRCVSYLTNTCTHDIEHPYVLFTPRRLILNKLFTRHVEHTHILFTSIWLMLHIHTQTTYPTPLGTFPSNTPHTSHTDTQSHYTFNARTCFSHIATSIHEPFVGYPGHRDHIPFIPLRLRPRRAAPAFFSLIFCGWNMCGAPVG